MLKMPSQNLLGRTDKNSKTFNLYSQPLSSGSNPECAKHKAKALLPFLYQEHWKRVGGATYHFTHLHLGNLHRNCTEHKIFNFFLKA
jgi:hypothetical protein